MDLSVSIIVTHVCRHNTELQQRVDEGVVKQVRIQEFHAHCLTFSLVAQSARMFHEASSPGLHAVCRGRLDPVCQALLAMTRS